MNKVLLHVADGREDTQEWRRVKVGISLRKGGPLPIRVKRKGVKVLLVDDGPQVGRSRALLWPEVRARPRRGWESAMTGMFV